MLLQLQRLKTREQDNMDCDDDRMEGFNRSNRLLAWRIRCD